jgi:predicted nucleotide-binding protein
MAKGNPQPYRPTITPETALRRFERLFQQIPTVRRDGIDSPLFSNWEGEVKIVLCDFYGEASAQFDQFNSIWFSPQVTSRSTPESRYVTVFNSGLDQAGAFLESRMNDLREAVLHETVEQTKASSRFTPDPNSRKVFVVHGHDERHKQTVARFLTQLKLEPIILHEQPDQGRTLIEKFEKYSGDVRCAVVILTPDDIAHPQNDPGREEFRARQNVILELGFFAGKLGRDHAIALVENGVVIPSDYHGVIYIPLDSPDWRLRLVKELKAAGIHIDANDAF